MTADPQRYLYNTHVATNQCGRSGGGIVLVPPCAAVKIVDMKPAGVVADGRVTAVFVAIWADRSDCEPSEEEAARNGSCRCVTRRRVFLGLESCGGRKRGSLFVRKSRRRW